MVELIGLVPNVGVLGIPLILEVNVLLVANNTTILNV